MCHVTLKVIYRLSRILISSYTTVKELFFFFFFGLSLFLFLRCWLISRLLFLYLSTLLWNFLEMLKYSNKKSPVNRHNTDRVKRNNILSPLFCFPLSVSLFMFPSSLTLWVYPGERNNRGTPLTTTILRLVVTLQKQLS